VDPARLHRPLKRLGQNFLRDPDVASRIVSLAGLGKNDTVLEPGAGYGTLTEQLQAVAAQVVAVEKDRHLAALLRSRFRDTPSIRIIEGDVLKVQLPPYNRVVGTPPYNVSSKLVLFLLSSKFETAHLVFQKEFGERLLARPGTADYGRLSVTAQRKLVMSPLLHIRRGAFNPVPKVDSLLLSFTPKPEQIGEGHDDEVFDDLVRAVFSQRRRVVKGVLLRYLERRLGRTSAKTALEGLTLPDARVFQLSPGQLEDLAVQLGPWLKPERVGEKRFEGSHAGLS